MADKFSFDKMLSKLREAKVDMPKEIAEVGEKYFAGNFRKQQSPDGVKWAPRKVKNNQSKYTSNGNERKRFNPILVKTGNLRDQMDHTIYKVDWKKIIWRVDPSKVPYAKYLNYGTTNADGSLRMVARPFLTTNGREIKGKIRGIIKRTFYKVMSPK